jgi:hypothetical protein
MSDIYTVTAEMRFDFNVQFSHPPLDAGERDLMIRALTLEDVWLLNSPDLAAVRFAHSRGLIERLVSLEAMCGLIKARLRADLRENYREAWLAGHRTAFNLGLM